MNGMGHGHLLLWWLLIRRSAVVATLSGAALSTMRFVIAPSAHRRLTTFAMKNHIRWSQAMRADASCRVRFEARGDDAHSRWNRIEMQGPATCATYEMRSLVRVCLSSGAKRLAERTRRQQTLPGRVQFGNRSCRYPVLFARAE